MNNNEILFISDDKAIRKDDIKEANKFGWKSHEDIEVFTHGCMTNMTVFCLEHNYAYEDGYVQGVKSDNDKKHANGWFNISEPNAQRSSSSKRNK